MIDQHSQAFVEVANLDDLLLELTEGVEVKLTALMGGNDEIRNRGACDQLARIAACDVDTDVFLFVIEAAQGGCNIVASFDQRQPGFEARCFALGEPFCGCPLRISIDQPHSMAA